MLETSDQFLNGGGWNSEIGNVNYVIYTLLIVVHSFFKPPKKFFLGVGAYFTLIYVFYFVEKVEMKNYYAIETRILITMKELLWAGG